MEVLCIELLVAILGNRISENWEKINSPYFLVEELQNMWRVYDSSVQKF